MIGQAQLVEFPLPDFENPGETEDWIQRQRLSGLADQYVIAALVENGSPQALVHAAWLCVNTRKHSEARTYAVQARVQNRLDTTLYADAILTLCDTAEELVSSAKTGQSGHNQIALLQPLLNRAQNAKPQSRLLLEAQLRILASLVLAHQSVGAFQTALECARQAKHLASGLQMHHSVDGCINLIACQLGLLGLEESAKNELEFGFRDGMRPSMASEFQRQLAHILFMGGNYESCTTLLENLPQLDSKATWNQVFLSFYGGQEATTIGSIPDPSARYANLLSPLILGSSALIQAEGLPRTNEFLGRRAELLQQVHSTIHLDRYNNEPYCLLIAQWMRAYASLRLGYLHDSLWQIQRIGSIPPEWLHARLIIWGLRLELALQFETSALISVAECEQQLRLVFRDAHGLSFGSPTGLAKRLSRWHPLGASYLAVHPEPIPELVSSQVALLQCVPKPNAWGIALEPALANEMVLRSLNLDVATSDFQEATRNPRVRAQVGSLTTEYGETRWWRPPQSIVPVVFGLACSGHPDAFSTAHYLLRRFGISAKTRNAANVGFFRTLEKALEALLSKKLSRGAFFELLPKALQPLPSSAKAKR